MCLGLGQRMKATGLKVGYMKPVSTQPWYQHGQLLDEDAAFAHRILSLEETPKELAPVIITDQLLEQALEGKLDRNLMDDIRTAYEKLGEGKDVLLMEGGANMREGTALGVRTVNVAREFDAPVLLVLRWDRPMYVVDGAMTAQYRFQQFEKDLLLGVVINSVPDTQRAFVNERIVPYLEEKGIPVFAVLPEHRNLTAISVEELLQVLGAELLAGRDKLGALVEELVVGAMSAHEALPRFRRYRNKAVITGGDRADIQLAALETSTVALILTGNLRPSQSVIGQAEVAGVAVLLVPEDTMATVDRIERVFGKTRLGHAEKLSHFQALLAEHMDYDRLMDMLEL
ncbi:MAG: phosphotransacetylase family protein [Anaerolineae bacterium]